MTQQESQGDGPRLVEDREDWPQILGALRDAPVAEVALQFGLAASEIRAAERRTGNGGRRRVVRPEPAAEPRAERRSQEESAGSAAKTPTARRRGPKSAIDAHADLVGIVADRVVAEKAGVTVGAVAQWRQRRGIPAASKAKRARKPAQPGPRKDRAKRDRSTGSELPEPAAGSSALRRKAGRGKRGPKSKIEPFAHLVGQVPDIEVARKAGVTRAAVAAWRHRRGIEPKAQKRGRVRQPKRGSKVDAFADLVGTVPDRVVAEKAGVTVSAVTEWRRRHGVPAASKGGRAKAKAKRPTGAPRVSAKQAVTPTATGAFAWRVELDDGTVGVVLGASVVEAAGLAEAAGKVQRVERVGPVLR